jgi:hypothetical protein
LPGFEFALLGGGAGELALSCGLRRVSPPVEPPAFGVLFMRASAGPLLVSKGSERPVSTVRARSAGGLAELPCVAGATEPLGFPVDGPCASAAPATTKPATKQAASAAVRRAPAGVLRLSDSLFDMQGVFISCSFSSELRHLPGVGLSDTA